LLRTSFRTKDQSYTWPVHAPFDIFCSTPVNNLSAKIDRRQLLENVVSFVHWRMRGTHSLLKLTSKGLTLYFLDYLMSRGLPYLMSSQLRLLHMKVCFSVHFAMHSLFSVHWVIQINYLLHADAASWYLPGTLLSNAVLSQNVVFCL
jgi:hypothetical protein